MLAPLRDRPSFLRALHRRKLSVGVVAALLALAAAAVLFACSQTPTTLPVRTFERAQLMDVACLRLYDPPNIGEPLTDFHPREPIGRPEQECAAVPADLPGDAFDKQLFALVTQTQRGELAVVDLSAGKLVDQSRATPGINFIPVGQNPTGVAVTPDGKMAFVASADPNKPAVYGIPTRRILGDTVGFPRDPTPTTLQSWPVCLLPQNPGAITVVPRAQATTPTADGGTDAGDAGDAGTATDGELPALYDIVVVLPGDRQNTAKVVTLDPRPFRRASLRELADGTPDYASDLSDGDAPTLNAGPNPLKVGTELQPCAILLESAVELGGGALVPSSFNAGPAWDDGVKYVDGGADLTCKRPLPAGQCGTTPCCAPISIVSASDEGGTDAAVDPDAAADAGTCIPLGTVDAGPIPLTLGPIDPPRLVTLKRSNQTLYIADEGAPLIHVVDLSTPTAPRELPPLLATSVSDPSRVVKIKNLAISPPTREYKIFLYAVDQADGSLMVYDITDPASTQRTPLLRPHPELNPFQAIDRIGFGSPVVAVEFARHDVPLAQVNGVLTPSSASGLLCNPSANLDAGTAPGLDLGYFYRADNGDPQQAIGPKRLRGVFAFATLSSGQVALIDVDDWDSPCRRPGFMDHDVTDIALAEPDASSPTDINPYHAPIVDTLGVTNEAFFPMAAPHTLRSSLLLTNDAVLGDNIPRVVATPQIASNGVTLTQVGPGSENTPRIGVAFSFEVPQVHSNQDWSIVYEPAIPGFEGVSATITTPDNYSSLVFTQPQAHFCTKGVEDWARGITRTRTINAELARRGTSLPAGAERWMTDYVQMSEDLLDVNDPYWSVKGQSCWEGDLADPPGNTPADGTVRHDFCAHVYGSLASDQKITRDFPIVEAYDDHVVVGRFYTPPGGHREVVYTDPSNSADLKLMQCCFHRQARFAVRTGQLWGAIGRPIGSAAGGFGFLTHGTTDSAGRCVDSCETREILLNARMPTIPSSISFDTVDKDSPLAMRNPMFTAVIAAGASGIEPVRDSVYGFTAIGGFVPLTVDISQGSTAVSPQSMRFVDSIGQMAVVDGVSQGLVLIDLQAVVLAHAPYF